MDHTPIEAAASSKRRPVTLTVRADLMEQAKALKLNASRAAEAGIANEVKKAQAEIWLAENREAIKAYNARIKDTGPRLTPEWAEQ